MYINTCTRVLFSTVTRVSCHLRLSQLTASAGDIVSGVPYWNSGAHKFESHPGQLSVMWMCIYTYPAAFSVSCAQSMLTCILKEACEKGWLAALEGNPLPIAP